MFCIGTLDCRPRGLVSMVVLAPAAASAALRALALASLSASSTWRSTGWGGGATGSIFGTFGERTNAPIV
mgnify:CR=1 FL=1